jgi:hemolysin activation/secretion protein
VGYQATESSDIQNTNNFSISDFSNTFYTTNFEYAAFRPEDILFPQQTIASVRAGIGSRESNQTTNNQFFTTVNLSHNFYLNQKNVVNIRSQNHYLQSDTYIVNELFRFGGINSIRGFNENSLQANMFTSILTEYRFVPAPNIYIHSIIDYGYFRDESSKNGGGLLGLGIGFGLLTNNGLLNLVYSNGSTDDQSIKLSNSIVHISFKTTF